jgi:hypothetical protein
MTWQLGLLMLVGVFLAGCGKHFWESPGRGVHEFSLDSSDCIKEATGKYGVASRRDLSGVHEGARLGPRSVDDSSEALRKTTSSLRPRTRSASARSRAATFRVQAQPPHADQEWSANEPTTISPSADGSHAREHRVTSGG